MFLALSFREIVRAVIDHFTPHNTLEIFGVCFGILTIVLGLINYVFTSRRTILAVKAVSDVFSGLNYLCYGKIVPMVTCGVALFREFVFYNRGRKKWADRKIWLYVFIAAISLIPLGAKLLSGEMLTWLDFFPVVGSCVVVYGFYSTDIIVIKICIIIGQVAYIFYNAWTGNIASTIASVTPMVSAIIGLIREIGRIKKEKAAAKEAG